MAETLLEADPHSVLDDATPGETIVADPSVVHTIDRPITITTDRVTLRGLNLELAAGTDENLVEIGADGVSFTDFHLDGARERQSTDRQSSGILATGASDVYVANGRVCDVSRHGLRIADTSDVTSPAPDNTIFVDRGPVSDVTVRDVRVDNPRRDGCSVEGPEVANVSVENVRTFDSSDRGSVEIKDGARDALVTNCYARRCVYGVAVQDHGEYPTTNLRILGNTAIECETAIDAQTSHPPANVAIVGNTGRNLGGDGMGGPGGIHAHLLEGLVLSNNVLETVDGPGIAIHDCSEGTVSGNVVRDTADAGIDVAGSDRLTLGQNGIAASGSDSISCRGGDGGVHNLLVCNNRCSGDLRLAEGIDRYMVAGNLIDGRLRIDCDGTGSVQNNVV